MVGILTMTGGASLAGVWVYKRLGDKKQMRRDKDPGQTAEQPWWKAQWQTLQGRLQSGLQRFTLHHPRAQGKSVADAPALDFAHRIDAADTSVRYGWHTSTLAVAVTTTGALAFPPLQLAGIPLLIYMGIPAAHQAYEQLWVDGRPSRALAETLALAACLASGTYFVGSLGFWLYYGTRTWLAEKRPAQTAQPTPWMTPTTVHLWKDGTTCAVPTTTLQPGDHVRLHSGDMTPMDGLITEGMAWLRPQALSATACGLRKGVGDRVTATDIVVLGQICVRVLPSA